MARLIEIQAEQPLPPELQVRVGDLLMFRAGGGRVLEGDQSVALLGCFSTSVVSDLGEVLSPAGGPDIVMFLARAAGPARIEVVTGDPWQGRTTPKQTGILVSP